MSGLLIAGTSSDAGKSLVVTGLCRAWRRRGVDVAPFKAQNMSNNSGICRDGSEIGRAQMLQAHAAGVEPSWLHNPVLLKPGTDRRSFVVAKGRPAGVLEAGEYATGREHLAEAAFEAYRTLAARHELVVVEGAGSPAEINLRGRDYVNMGLARQFDLPVVLVGDIDRGGVLASIYGTWGLLDADDRALLRAYIINKFRGDADVLTPGLVELTRRTGLPSLGVLPWLDSVWLDGEDALEVGRWRHDGRRDDATLTVAVVRLPRISNATDVDALAHEPGVDVVVTTDAATCAQADLVVLPGSRSTVSDLAWLRERGIGAALVERHERGLPTVGICGGYEMLAETIADEVESGTGMTPGLGVLPVSVTFGEDKVTTRATYPWRGLDVEGYEIHHGVCTPTEACEPFLDGVRHGTTWGTMLHGCFEDDTFRRAFLGEVASLTRSEWRPSDAPGYRARREAMIERLADAVEEHVDLDALADLAMVERTTPPVEHTSPLVERRAQPAVETAQRTPREHPLLIVHTGPGKGKTTAAFGLALRSWAQGWSIGVHQFVKGSTWPTGERRAFEVLAASEQGGTVKWYSLGVGRTTLRAHADVDHAALAREGWQRVTEQLAAQTHRLYVLDEFAHVLARGWLDVDEVIATLRDRPGLQYVVITGRNCPQAVLDAADLVTSMEAVKHPYHQGIRGQAGIEW